MFVLSQFSPRDASATAKQWRSHTSGVRGVRTRCQDVMFLVCDFSVFALIIFLPRVHFISFFSVTVLCSRLHIDLSVVTRQSLGAR